MNHSRPIGSKKPAKMLALAVVALAMAPAAGIANTTAPLIGAGQAGVIGDRYIVVMKRAASDASKQDTKNRSRARGAKIHRNYRTALNGYAASLPAAALAEVRADPDVA